MWTVSFKPQAIPAQIKKPRNHIYERQDKKRRPDWDLEDHDLKAQCEETQEREVIKTEEVKYKRTPY